MPWQTISKQIEAATGEPFKVVSTHPLSGGDINTAFLLKGDRKSYFIKLNKAELSLMFEAELAGLQELANTQTIRVPVPISCGQASEQAYLVLEYIFFGSKNKTSERLLGQQLALMHRQQQPYFGWHRQNTIGSTLQSNIKSEEWLTFWREQRLTFQLQLLAKKGYTGKLQLDGERLCSELPLLFTQYQPQASLLHGDLWAGNVAVDQQGRPIIFDPACYYGDREADLAMTELFGGFSQDFYAAYQNVWPLEAGYAVRKTFYNLYHILNHLNLFGGGYLRQAESMMSLILSEIH